MSSVTMPSGVKIARSPLYASTGSPALGEPQVAVRTRRDSEGRRPAGDPDADNSVITPAGVMRPICLAFSSVNQNCPIGTRRDAKWLRARADPRVELGDDFGGGDSPNPTAGLLGEPQIAIRTGGDFRQLRSFGNSGRTR